MQMSAQSPEAIAAECTEFVRDAVIAARAALGSLKAALPDVARRYGLTERRVQHYWWSRVTFVAAHEFSAIRSARKRDLALRELRLDHQLAMTRATLAEQRKSDAETSRGLGRVAGREAAGSLRGWGQALAGADPVGGPAQGSLNLGLAYGRR